VEIVNLHVKQNTLLGAAQNNKFLHWARDECSKFSHCRNPAFETVARETIVTRFWKYRY